jgi:hypothetical protein
MRGAKICNFKKLSWANNNRPNCENSPNLVTLIIWSGKYVMFQGFVCILQQLFRYEMRNKFCFRFNHIMVVAPEVSFQANTWSSGLYSKRGQCYDSWNIFGESIWATKCVFFYFNFGLMVRGLSQRPNLPEASALTRDSWRSIKEEEKKNKMAAWTQITSI